MAADYYSVYPDEVDARIREDEEATARLLLQHQVEQFLYREARYLDERRLTEWLDFFAEDVHYYMPIRRNINSA